MFTSTGLFKHIPCPKSRGCDVVNCIFSHDVEESNALPHIGKISHDPSTAVTDVSPDDSRPLKRRRIASPEPRWHVAVTSVEDVGEESIRSADTSPLQSPLVRPHAETKGPAKTSTSASDSKHSSTGLSSEKKTLKAVPRSTTKPVSPPPVARRSKQTVPFPETPLLKQEALLPRQVTRPPAQYKAREAALKLLHKSMNTLNNQLKGSDVKREALVLSVDELTRMALDEEEQIALTCAENIYQQTIGRRIRSLQKMSANEWKDLVIQKYKKALVPATTEVSHLPKEPSLDTDLSSQEEITILRELRTPLEGLEKHGYVTQPPTDAELTEARKVLQDSARWEVCDRCGTRFRVIPGRDEDGRLTTKGKCSYHWARLLRPLRQRSDAITGQQEPHYPCCGQTQGTEGCTVGDSHVFKVTDPKRLATVLQFEHTSTTSLKPKTPLAFDCEMAYTTLGLELIRLTAVSWPQAQQVLDILVRPFGEILDLNTRFSGITKEQYTDATPYDEADAVNGECLSKVPSPAHARALLLQHLTPSTPLLGHAIDNDLNACRIIHPFIVDTVLLYPHPRGLPVRYSLKMLAGKYLSRSIQRAGAQGHNSKEDAVATGDLVRVKVAERWKTLRLEGWELHAGKLLKPQQD